MHICANKTVNIQIFSKTFANIWSVISNFTNSWTRFRASRVFLFVKTAPSSQDPDHHDGVILIWKGMQGIYQVLLCSRHASFISTPPRPSAYKAHSHEEIIEMFFCRDLSFSEHNDRVGQEESLPFITTYFRKIPCNEKNDIYIILA